MDVKISIDGVKELNDLLQKLPDKIEKKALDNAMRTGANVVKKAAQSKAPVNTGLLRDSIKVKKDSSQQKAGAFQVGIFKERKKHYPFYAHMIEFGTSKMQAQPFLRPAFDENRAEALKRIVERLAKSITTEALKFGGLKPSKHK